MVDILWQKGWEKGLGANLAIREFQGSPSKGIS